MVFYAARFSSWVIFPLYRGYIFSPQTISYNHTHFFIILDLISIGTATVAETGSPFVTCGTASLRDRSRPYFTYPDHRPLKDVALFKKKACGRIPSR